MLRRHHLSLCTILVAACCGLFSSCLTLGGEKATTVTLTIDSNCSEPVSIFTSEQAYDSVTLPTQIEVKKKHLNLPIYITSPNYRFSTFYPGRRSNDLAWVFAYFTGGISAIVDLSTGAWYEPRQTGYFVHSVRQDSSRQGLDSLPSNDFRGISALKPHGMNFYRHELRLMGGLGAYVKNSDYEKNCQNVYDRFSLGPDVDYYCGIDCAAGFSAEYFCHLNKQWAIGAMTGSSRYCEDMGYTSYLFSGEDFQGYYAGSMYTTSTYVMPAVKYNWLFHKGFSCYSKAGLGLSAQHVWFDKAHPNMETQSYEYMREYDHRFHRLEGQLTFIGMEIGKGSLRFFTELGWGLEGVFNIGFSYHFHRF